jgi:FkbH-like protein
MVLRLDDIAVFVANWENKVDNIREIRDILGIGFDTMVFLDDSPFERAMVREALPAITVPELPEDPADYLDYLYTLNLFETGSYSREDSERTGFYQTEARRTIEKRRYMDETVFLEGLKMVSAAAPFNRFNAPRVAQLSQRSNQFNLRTVRYTEADILHMIDSPDLFGFSFTLGDRMGDNGMIAVVVLRKETANRLFIDTWIMSCRVLKRGMEAFTLNRIASFAREKGFRYLKGQYLPTAKNELVREHYAGLGFWQEGGYWLLDLLSFEPLKTYISIQ